MKVLLCVPPSAILIFSEPPITYSCKTLFRVMFFLWFPFVRNWHKKVLTTCKILIQLINERSPVWFLPLDDNICYVQIVFYEIIPKLLLFPAQMKEKQLPPNATPEVFKKDDTSVVKMEIKFWLGNTKVLKPSIGRI